MKKYFMLTLFFLFLICLFNCAKEEHPFVTLYKEKGIDAVVISGKPSGDKSLYYFEEVLSIGGEEPEPVVFQPGECLIDDDGNLYFSDEGRIKKFDQNGNFVQFIGTKGLGPGEIDFPSLKQIFIDTLLVGQSRWRGGKKLEVFDIKGKYIKRINYPTFSKSIFEGRRNSLECYIGGDIFLVSSSLMEKQESKLFNEPKFGFAYSDGRVFRELDLTIEKFASTIDFGGMGTSMPFAQIQCPVYYNKKLYILSQNGTDIFIFSKNGDMIKAIKLNFQGTEVTNEEIEKYFSNWPEEYAKLARKVDLPDRKPFVYDIIVDNTGKLWLNKGGTFGVNPSEVDEYIYIVIDEKGKYVADQVVPVKLIKVMNGFAYGFQVKEDGLKIFKKYRLRMR
ncbi:hypothetical protein ACFL4T_10350 [candidate division KSB1 bacterium]